MEEKGAPRKHRFGGNEMDRGLVAQAEADIQAPSSRVWEALTTPSIIKKYFFGSDIVTDWTVGSPILYRGEWQGKAYEDKGSVLEVEPERSLVVTHWSPLSGTKDAPENYHTVRYSLASHGGSTSVTIRQDNNASPEEVRHSENNWAGVLAALKSLLEGETTVPK
jgi:uncharacterized protein YndB with AHSA1/START domain